MVADYFFNKIKHNFGLEPTPQQEETLRLIADFLFVPHADNLFLLKGYAGTGKSSLVGALVRTMTELGQKTVLLAPTGRAAKVLSNYAGHPASTIHKKIYRQQRFGGGSAFAVMDNLHKDTLFLVDEASMISNEGLDSSLFGTGRLLDDLVHYVYSGENCRLLLVGDTAQLPPVGQEQSPALQKEVLGGYGLDVAGTTLTQVVRQAGDSGILFNATNIRDLLNEGLTEAYPKLKLDGFTDIIRINGQEMVEELAMAYDRDGMEETMVVSRSNKRANIFNQGIRNQILYREEELSAGDLVQIVKNNYSVSQPAEGVDFLANGEIVEIIRVRRVTEIYGFRFCDALIRHLDYDVELEVKILLDTLHSEAAALPHDRQNELFNQIAADYTTEVTNRRDLMRKIKADPYFNALQVKYGYAVTCHKAQGGEWRNVFLDLGYIAEEHLGINFYRWLYTALTRATRRLYLVNLPDDFL